MQSAARVYRTRGVVIITTISIIVAATIAPASIIVLIHIITISTIVAIIVTCLLDCAMNPCT